MRAVLSRALLHAISLRSCSEPNDLKAGIDMKHLEVIGVISEKLPEKNRQCILFCDQEYGNKKVEHNNGTILRVAENQPDVMAAKNILAFIVQAVFCKFRMVV